MTVSFAVHSYNEADALKRLVLSSLPFAGLFREWVIVDHRSDDHTSDVLDELRPVLEAGGITLRTEYEGRDLSAQCTFADIRNRTIKACAYPVVVLHDADFLLGPRFSDVLKRSAVALAAKGSRYYSAAYSIPCVWDHLETNAAGVVTGHGRVWVHEIRPRILWRDAVHYEQTKDGGRWERLVIDDRTRTQRLNLTANRRGPLTPDTLLSCNVKPGERIALRDTMTMFMQDVVRGKATGGWLENYRAGTVRSQPAYDYQNRSVVGWHLHAPNLRLACESAVSA